MKTAPKVTPKAKALFDFDGEFEDELSFKVSARIVHLLLFKEAFSVIFSRPTTCPGSGKLSDNGLAPVVQWADSVILWISRYPVDEICRKNLI